MRDSKRMINIVLQLRTYVFVCSISFIENPNVDRSQVTTRETLDWHAGTHASSIRNQIRFALGKRSGGLTLVAARVVPASTTYGLLLLVRLFSPG